MTRTEYLEQLECYLNKLPQTDYEEAMDYFREYFDEAGSENEAQVIEELGSPKDAARDLLARLLDEKLTEENQSPKKHANYIWIAILVVLASPIAFPLALLFLALILTAVLLGIALIACLMVIGLTCLVCGISIFFDSLSYFTSSLSVALLGSGLGLLAFGLSILAILASIESAKACGRGIAALTRWAINKGRKA